MSLLAMRAHGRSSSIMRRSNAFHPDPQPAPFTIHHTCGGIGDEICLVLGDEICLGLEDTSSMRAGAPHTIQSTSHRM